MSGDIGQIWDYFFQFPGRVHTSGPQPTFYFEIRPASRTVALLERMRIATHLRSLGMPRTTHIGHARAFVVRRFRRRALRSSQRPGNTVPFVARYRKEQTGCMDEVALRRVERGLRRLEALESRRARVALALQKDSPGGRAQVPCARACGTCNVGVRWGATRCSVGSGMREDFVSTGSGACRHGAICAAASQPKRHTHVSATRPVVHVAACVPLPGELVPGDHAHARETLVVARSSGRHDRELERHAHLWLLPRALHTSGFSAELIIVVGRSRESGALLDPDSRRFSFVQQLVVDASYLGRPGLDHLGRQIIAFLQVARREASVLVGIPHESRSVEGGKRIECSCRIRTRWRAQMERPIRDTHVDGGHDAQCVVVWARSIRNASKRNKI